MIAQLPRVLIDQIAAGEVVVRPASVVKELVENSTDAEARHITVSTANALRDITVTDDGFGMGEEDARLSLERHATSKIRSLDDLHNLETRGFRGEALPSIAAVSRLKLTTRRPEDVAATRIVVEGGMTQSVESVGAPAGTKIEVRDLFYNTPARLKFLKSAATELGQVTRTVIRQALASHSTGIRFTNQKRPFLDLPAGQPLDSRAQQLLGVPAENLLSVDFEKYDVQIRGFVAKPAEARRDRRHQFFFVNDRPISHRTLSYSVQQAYEGLLMTRRFPVLILFIEIDPKEVDVNVHPTKDEVRFREENKITGLIHRAVMQALHAANLVPEISLPKTGAAPPEQPLRMDFQEEFLKAGQALRPPAPPYSAPLSGALRSTPPVQVVSPDSGESSPDSPRPDVPPANAKDEVESLKTLEPPAASVVAGFPTDATPRALGQIADSYIVAEAGEDLLLIDQHAAHERLLYLKAREKQSMAATQPLLVPISVEVKPADRPLMEDLAPVLAEMGFETEAFGGQTFIIRSLPSMFDRVDVHAFISDLLDELANDRTAREGERVRECVLTRLACHAAIKAGQHLQPEEMQKLIDDLVVSRLAYTCPHGRPTMIRLTRDQLDRQFKRK